MSEHASDDALLDLMHGLSSGDAHDAVVSHLLGCAECDARFRVMVRDHEQGLARAPTALSQARMGAPTRGVVTATGSRRWAWSRITQVAAGVLILVGSAWLLAPRGGGSGAAARARNAWLPAAAHWGNLREAAEAGPDSTILAGIAAYDRRDLRRAERLLHSPGSGSAYEMLRRLYLANTLVALGRPREALPVLVGFSWELPEPWRGEWDWTNMVACAHAGLPARADSLLDVLSQRDDSIGERARTLARDARDLR